MKVTLFNGGVKQLDVLHLKQNLPEGTGTVFKSGVAVFAKFVKFLLTQQTLKSPIS